jgi:hypothetical protein
LSKLAVLTGDIVNSSSLGDRISEVQNKLKSIPVEFNKYYPNAILENVSIHRGDGWQVVVGKRQYAIRVALFIKSILKAHFNIETRVSIGIGEVSKLDESNISASLGTAFELSGKGLDELDQDKYLMISNRQSYFEISFLDCILKRHTTEQANAFSSALLGLTQAEIGNAVNKSVSNSTKPKSQQAIAGLLERGFWREILEYLNYFEEKKQH